MAFLSEHLENSLHRCPIVCLGSGRLGLVDKFIAILHALGLEAALTMDSWVSFVKEIAVGTSDLGVEFGLNCCKDTPLSSLLPHFHVSRPVGAVVDDVVDLDPGESPSLKSQAYHLRICFPPLAFSTSCTTSPTTC